MTHAAPVYDEFLVLRYKATNEPPYPFEWVDYRDTVQEYGSILTRISRNYEKRFSTEFTMARKDSGPAQGKPRVVVSHSRSGLTVTNHGPRLFGVNFKSHPVEDMVVKFEPVPALGQVGAHPLTFSIVSTDGKTSFACGLEVVALAAPHSMVPVIITCQDGQRRWWEGVGALVRTIKQPGNGIQAGSMKCVNCRCHDTCAQNFGLSHYSFHYTAENIAARFLLMAKDLRLTGNRGC